MEALRITFCGHFGKFNYTVVQIFRDIQFFVLSCICDVIVIEMELLHSKFNKMLNDGNYYVMRLY